MINRPARLCGAAGILGVCLALLPSCVRWQSDDRAVAVDPTGERERWWAGVQADLGSEPTLGQVVAWVKSHRADRPHMDLGTDGWDFERASVWVLALDEDWSLMAGSQRAESFSTRESQYPNRATLLGVVGLPAFRDRFPPELYEAVREIARAPVTGERVDPVNWIRAVNTLHAMGKDGALAALEAFGRAGWSRTQGPYRGTGDQVFWITQVLFEQNAGGMPPPVLGQPNAPGLNEPAGAHASLYPVVVQDDVPFLLASGYDLTGLREPVSARLAYCREHCRLRERPLRPSATPAEAAEKVVAMLPDDPASEQVIDRLRDQARRASENFLSASQLPREPLYESQTFRTRDERDAAWKQFAALSAGAGAEWSVDARDFVAPVRVLESDFNILTGRPWTGTLTYLDYTSGKPTTIRSSLSVSKREPSGVGGAGLEWEMRIGYTDEPSKDSGDVLVLGEGGRRIDGETVIERTVIEGGAIRIVTEERARDNGHPAMLRRVYQIGPKEFSRQKLVRYASGGGEFFERHVYRWTR